MSTLTSIKDGSLGSGPNMSAVKDGSLGALNMQSYQNGSLGRLNMNSYRDGSLGGGCGCSGSYKDGSLGEALTMKSPVVWIALVGFALVMTPIIFGDLSPKKS